MSRKARIVLCVAALLAFGAGCSGEREEPPVQGTDEALERGEVPQHGAPPGEAPPEPPPARRETRSRLSGYATPAEILRLDSPRYPEGVVVVALPLDYYDRPDKFYPLVIAFGGAGECARPPEQGALAWMGYYKADEAVKALEDNRLEREDFRELVSEEELRGFNEKLRSHPYEGVILACPSSPLLSRDLPLDSPDYEAFLMEEALPALTSLYRVDPGRVGVDGVSMGGARSMYYGLKHPQVFMRTGAVQGAFSPRSLYEDLVRKNRDALLERRIQIVTSDGDSLRGSSLWMHGLLEKHGIPHRFLILTGPHDYVFNQGPGSLALLLFHGRRAE